MATQLYAALPLASHTGAEFLTGQIRGSKLPIFPQASSADLQACRNPLTYRPGQLKFLQKIRCVRSGENRPNSFNLSADPGLCASVLELKRVPYIILSNTSKISLENDDKIKKSTNISNKKFNRAPLTSRHCHISKKNLNPEQLLTSSVLLFTPSYDGTYCPGVKLLVGGWKTNWQ
jgi:hypothetical protein